MRKNNKTFKSTKSNNLKSDTLSISAEYIKRKDKITSFFLGSKYFPVTKKELASLLVVPRDDLNILKNILNDLKEEGVISLNDNGKYVRVDEKNSFKCKYEYKNEEFGFAIVKDSDEDDIYIPREKSLKALDSDEILVVLDTSKKYRNFKRRVGRVVKITKRAIEYVVGEVYTIKKKIFVMPIENKMPSILINKNFSKENVISGMMVKVKITSYPDKKRSFEGNIEEVVCFKDEVNSYVKALYSSYGLDEKQKFSKEIEEEIKSIPDEVQSVDLKNRIDKTQDHVYTIDSEDAKDLDDAICVKKRKDGTYDLSVHIADVSHYVKDGSYLDKEAIKRGTSIYVPGSVIPMLPKKLSNGICSLNENKIRLTLSVDMHIDKNGIVTDSKIYKGYIKSKKKMTYEKVYKCIIKSDEKVLKEYNEYLEDISLMLELANILNARRMDMGSINFDIPETKVELNKDGSVKDIHPYDKNISNNIIEEFMLITNMTVAETFLHYDAPFIYRIHEKPDEEKLKSLNDVLSSYNKRIKSIKGVTPKVISKLLTNFETEEEKQVISTITLRTLKLAKYDSNCLGHFGLAFKYYCHFTSPIRRYPDLFIHRIISDYLKNNYILSENKQSKYSKEVIAYSISSSELEKEATKIEREFDDMYMAMFMKEKIGEIYEGVVSSVTSFGLFVKLPSTIEGLIHISSLKGYYVFDEKKCRLVNKSGKIYKIGDKVKIKVEKVDIRLKQIDFVLV